MGAANEEGRYRVQGVDGLGLEHGVLRLQRSPVGWVAAGRDLARQVAGTLGEQVVAVEHIGSTAVPGLLAKPIIDLAVGVRSESDWKKVECTLTAWGWNYRGDAGEQGGHVFVLERRPSLRVAHLHVIEHEGDQWRRYLALRNRLRTDASARDAYESVKLALVTEFGDNRRRDYTTGKTSIINDLTGD